MSVKLCSLRIHRWQKRKKQWIGKNGLPIMSKKCHYCGTLKEEDKLIDNIKKVVTKVRGLNNAS